MATATINGAGELTLPSGVRIHVQASEDFSSVTVSAADAGAEIWRTGPLAMGPEPTLAASGSATANYLGLYWPSTGMVVILGDPRAVVLSAADGQTVAEFSLESTGQTSLDLAGLELSSDGSLLLIVSSRRVWLVNSDLDVVLRYEPRFLLAERPRLDGSDLIITAFDFDSAEELVREVIPLAEPRAPGSEWK